MQNGEHFPVSVLQQCGELRIEYICIYDYDGAIIFRIGIILRYPRQPTPATRVYTINSFNGSPQLGQPYIN